MSAKSGHTNNCRCQWLSVQAINCLFLQLSVKQNSNYYNEKCNRYRNRRDRPSHNCKLLLRISRFQGPATYHTRRQNNGSIGFYRLHRAFTVFYKIS